MRLDTLGKPPLVQSDSFDRAKVLPLKIGPVSATRPPEESGQDPGSGQRAPRLGKILSILQKGQDEHKRKAKKKTSVVEGLKAYQRATVVEISAEHVGQTLNIKV